MGKPAKILSKDDLERAMKMTRSNFAAARYLHVSYNHYKKYAKLYKNDEGITFLEAHKNQEGKGIPKFALKASSKIPLMDLLEGRVPIEHFNAREIKERVIFEGLIEEKQAEAMEDYVKTKADEPDWEMDEHHREHLKELGLFSDDEEEDYISRL